MKKLVLTLIVLLFIASLSVVAQKRKGGRTLTKDNAQTLAIKKQIVNTLLTKASVKECGGANKIVYVLEKIDLNKDGKPEFIAYLNCNGLGFYVLRKTATGVEVVFDCGGCERESVTPLKTYTKGWRNLRFDSHSAGTGEGGSEVLRWNGSEYINKP